MNPVLSSRRRQRNIIATLNHLNTNSMPPLLYAITALGHCKFLEYLFPSGAFPV